MDDVISLTTLCARVVEGGVVSVLERWVVVAWTLE